jgi:hypothetical protein
LLSDALPAAYEPNKMIFSGLNNTAILFIMSFIFAIPIILLINLHATNKFYQDYFTPISIAKWQGRE